MRIITNYKLQIINYKKALAGFLNPWLDIIKKPAVRLLVLSVLFLAVISAYFTATKDPGLNRFGPLPYPQELNLAGENLPQIKIGFNFTKDLRLPKTINVYRLEPPSEDKNRLFFDKVASSLGATVSAEIKTIGQNKAYLVSLPNFYFVGNLSSGGFSFAGHGKTFIATGEEDLKSSVFEYLVSLGADGFASVPTVNYYNFSGSELEVSQNSLQADILSLSYPFTVDSLPVVGLAAAGPLRVLIEKKTGNIIKIDYSVLKIEPGVFGQYEVLTLPELIKTPTGHFLLLSLTERGGGKMTNFQLSDLSSLQFGVLTLAYLFSPDQEILIPVFLLNGDADLKDGRTGNATVALPAVKNISHAP